LQKKLYYFPLLDLLVLALSGLEFYSIFRYSIVSVPIGTLF
jgi:hypothetical protein